MPRSEEEIQAMIDRILELRDQGKGNRWPGMTYEEGVEAALRWVLGDGEDPMEE